MSDAINCKKKKKKIWSPTSGQDGLQIVIEQTLLPRGMVLAT